MEGINSVSESSCRDRQSDTTLQVQSHEMTIVRPSRVGVYGPLGDGVIL